MHLHAHELDTRKSVIDEAKMLIQEFPTVHVASFEGSDTSTRLRASGSEPLSCHQDHD
jgi:hypothetical protein